MYRVCLFLFQPRHGLGSTILLNALGGQCLYDNIRADMPSIDLAVCIMALTEIKK